ncbi:MAG: flagellar protein FlaG [Pelotomaculum sp. PtaB.Bin104]|nr:MAG: flagellar protein FlaG [Pelotomaculum sp. PtaB.Bin104]
MEISSVKSPLNNMPEQKEKSAMSGQKINAQTVDSFQIPIVSDDMNEKAVQKSTLQDSVNKINKVLDLLNTNIQFSLYEDTKTLMVQVVDIKDKRVIKEYPPREFLDTMAKIREYIGILLDVQV